MSVYVGIDVHRKRSQVAVVTEDGQVQLNKNVVNGSTPFLQLIGDLPLGTPVAFEAAFGWSWLAELLEDYGFEAHLVHPLRCDRLGRHGGRRVRAERRLCTPPAAPPDRPLSVCRVAVEFEPPRLPPVAENPGRQSLLGQLGLDGAI